jgi:uncharacterized membrane protein YphA (DoxX/SURF4 family)
MTGGVLLLVARLVVGGAFVMLALAKLADPVAFLKSVREYGLVADDSRLLNLAAALLPWVELLCGALLVLGVAVRGNALLLAGLLAVFTTAIAARAADMHAASGGAFCDLAFDCGCGTGVENVCTKLAQNAVLFVLALFALFAHSRRFCLRGELFGPEPAGSASQDP